jgi:putative hydrolase of the HAD superfamily
MKKYAHIFFDLDRTIWDFDASTLDSFNRMYQKYKLKSKGVPSVEDLKKHYDVHNDYLWELYRNGKILKEVLSVQRFDMTLADFGIVNNSIATGMSEDHVTLDPEKAFLMPYALECLDYLSSRYQLHLLSNGFKEVQEQKYNIARLGRFFRTVTTSEEAGIKKPEPGIFLFALKRAGCKAEDAIMIGDDLEVDIIGARNIGMDQVYYNTDGHFQNEKATYEVSSLKHLLEIL